MTDKAYEELTLHLCRSNELSHAQAERLIEEVLAFFDELPEDFIRRRHRELQQQGLANAAIFTVLREEMSKRLFPAASVSERQIRRTIYG